MSNTEMMNEYGTLLRIFSIWMHHDMTEFNDIDLNQVAARIRELSKMLTDAGIDPKTVPMLTV
jgi:hypothetical protein